MKKEKMMHPLVYKAYIFAMAAHAAVGQLRDFTGDPYIVHPKEVAEILARYGASPEAQAAGLLHDVLEDTKVTFEMLVAEFGYVVAALVKMVTNVAKPEDGKRPVRARINLEHKAKAEPEGQDIAMADIISNLRTLASLKPSFAKVYVPEKFAAVTALDKGNPLLREEALAVVLAAADELGMSFEAV